LLPKFADNLEEVLQEFADGKPEAFLLVFQTYSSKLYTFAFKITRSRELAEEVVQDVFLNVWLNREKLRDVRNLDAYLNRVTRNLSLNVLRDLAKEKLLTRDIVADEHFEDDSTQQALNHKDLVGLVHLAIAQLPAQQQRVYQLCHAEGLSYEQAAQALNVAPSTIHSHMKSALKSIRGHFRKMGVPMAIILMLFP
jgi:RNA polymerase sigma-70 factor (family 1)